MNLSPRFFKDEIAELDLNKTEDLPLIEKVCYALSSSTRLQILRQLQEGNKTIPQLAQENNLATTSVVYHTEILANAGLIDIALTPSQKGDVRTCYKVLRKLGINVAQPYNAEKTTKQVTLSCGVGTFVDCSSDFDCSFATKEQVFISRWDSVYRNERYLAEIIWANKGFLKYAFPNDFAKNNACQELEISLEICSEAINYDNHYKSDVTFWINDVELCTYTCLGDFGDRPGRLNPDWWLTQDSPTQYGQLVTIKIDSNGVYLNGDLLNKKVKLNSLNLASSNKLTFKLGNKPGMANEGGFNVFGKSFGDYPQDILLKATIK